MRKPFSEKRIANMKAGWVKRREKYGPSGNSTGKPGNWQGGKSYLKFNGKLVPQKKVYEELVKRQGEVCAICGKPETVKIAPSQGGGISRLSIDHDHNTGKVRGLLCHNCNNGIGRFMDDVEFMLKAIRYLRRND